MKFQNCILINFEPTHGRTGPKEYDSPKAICPIQLFRSWGGGGINS